jgi:hypothetical protein
MRRVAISSLINNESSIGDPRGVNPQSSISNRRRQRRWWEPVKNGRTARENAHGSRKLCKSDFCHFRLGIVRPIRTASLNRSRINNWFVEKKNTTLMKIDHIERKTSGSEVLQIENSGKVKYILRKRRKSIREIDFIEF